MQDLDVFCQPSTGETDYLLELPFVSGIEVSSSVDKLNHVTER